jgi:hypothetical protein
VQVDIIFKNIMKDSVDGISHKPDQYFGQFPSSGFFKATFQRLNFSSPPDQVKPRQSRKHMSPRNLNTEKNVNFEALPF